MKKLMRERIYTMLDDELKKRRRLLEENRSKINCLAKDQKRIKADFHEINNLLWELKKQEGPKK